MYVAPQSDMEVVTIAKESDKVLEQHLDPIFFGGGDQMGGGTIQNNLGVTDLVPLSGSVRNCEFPRQVPDIFSSFDCNSFLPG